ncbi:MAG: MTH938/NDUFAF3 family protein [Desulfovermiculus sp.]|nr:MTH938/NDUFAF3 family protein [Desulfovermiculus sp.]
MIEGYSFGRMTIQGRMYTDDVLICNEMLVSPWWRHKGHVVQVRDLDAVLGHTPKVIILGQGQPGQMKASRELQDHLQALGIELIQKPTQEAVDIFNRHLSQGERVCGGFHLTC